MITAGKYKIYFGDFHGQWNSSREELALLPAGLSYHGYDFTVFQTPSVFPDLKSILEDNEIDIISFPGLECMYEWGHLTTASLRGEPPARDNPDTEEVLQWFQKHTDWTIMAHPYPFMIDKLEGLIDQQLLTAVELVNGFVDPNCSRVKWYYGLYEKGKKIPIVSGLDIHAPAGSRRPSVLYSSAYKPEDDITIFNSNRTGVICEECDIDSIKQSIQSFQTFIEIPEGETLIGPPEITDYLESHGYWDAVAEDLEQRRSLTPETEDLLIAGQKNSFSWSSTPDKIFVDGKAKSCELRETDISLPVKYNRNTHYINMVSVKNNHKYINALKVYHPLNVNIYSDLEDGRCRSILNVVNVTRESIPDIDIEISSRDQIFTRKISRLKINESIDVVNEWNIADPSRPQLFKIKLTAAGYTKCMEKYLVFTECRYIADIHDDKSWESLPIIKMTGNNPEQIDPVFTVSWDGEENLSAELQAAWNENGLYFKVTVIDDVLVPSKTDLLMFGDCFQIGLNPVGTEAVGNQSFYDIMMTRGTEEGEEKAYMERPVNMSLESPLNKRILLSGLYDTEITDAGFAGLLSLPFHRISPMQPVEGYRFGLYLTIFDNDGTGLKTLLQWPLAAEKHLKQAWYIPYGGAWANFKLGKKN
jgi:hypothetical protein